MLKRLLLLALLVLPVPSLAADKVHRLALQITDDSPEKMSSVLNNAANAARYYASKGEELEIRIVAYSGGLVMFRADKSPVLERLKSVSQSLPNVQFEACQNTLEGMARAEGKKVSDIPLVEGAKLVPAGVVELLELSEQGWTIVRP
jgi:hypothetical protein